MSSATTTGSTTTAKKPTAVNTTYPAATMTRNRQPQAAARSRPHGTWARVKLDGPVWIGSGSARRSSRSWDHWWASRWAMPSSSSVRLRSPMIGSLRRPSGALLPAPSSGRGPAWSATPSSPGPSASLLTATGYPPGASSTRSTSRYAATGCRSASRPAAART